MSERRFYQPELSREKATFFSRCFHHCLQCRDFGEITLDEERYIIRFISFVEREGFALDALRERYRIREEEKAASALRDAIENS